MSVALSIKYGQCKHRQDTRWYREYCYWKVVTRDQDYQHMMLYRPLSILEILQKHIGQMKWYLLNQARNHGGMYTQKWPSTDFGGLKGVHVDTQYDVLTQNYQCQLTYRTSYQQWIARFIITEREIHAHGM